MPDKSFLSWPFFEPRHRDLAAWVETWAHENLSQTDHSDTDAVCRALVAKMGEDGLLTHSAI